MRKLFLLALTPFLLAASDADLPGHPPGVPERCCGYLDCRPAQIRILQRNRFHDIVDVDGKRLVLPAGSAHLSQRSGSWWCFQSVRERCHLEVSERCARCAVEGRRAVSELRLIPAPENPKGSHLALPQGGCAGCHGRETRPAN